tara:strand:+ start:126 stop:935 length:810 start_codon:yes stop_codon:yes gene_type:complete
MIIFKSINKLKNQVNFKANVGFVPTMGSLHKGHKSLIKISKNECDKTLVSIFVNPSQFNKSSDYKRYPRNFKNDLKILKKLKVDYVLVPSIKDIYKKKNQMKIKLNRNDKILCSKYRPGHFEGVLGVISIFLKNIKAKSMFLGNKDFQQVFIIRKYLQKKYKTKIINCKTIRFKNSFPYSSRNNLLSKKNLNNGILISNILKKFHKQIIKDFSRVKEIKNIIDKISKKCSRIEYLEIRNKNNLSKNINKKNFKIFIAYYFGNVRLIDNF